ncbi:hypothetical protein BTZ20_4744 [Rhodococcus sp. MTM3W5.2]|nr:hypothetical protein BTZ20_4744 [Rhodococcus sp. MTM3W5.2]
MTGQAYTQDASLQQDWVTTWGIAKQLPIWGSGQAALRTGSLR